MKPAEYIAEVVVPTVHDFRENRRSRRHAYLACIVTFHVKDHLKRAGETAIEDKLRANGEVFFDVVRGVCNGAKHVTTNGGRQAAFTVGDDTEREAAAYGGGAYGIGRYGDPGGREVETPDGHVDLYDACAWVLRSYVTHFPHHFGGIVFDGI